MLRPRRENGKMLFVLLCVFFLVVFFSRYDIDIWLLATVSLAELMKSPEASDWSTLASDWSNKITFSNSNMGLRAKERHGKNLVLTCASKKRDGVKSFPSLEFWVSLSCVLDKDKPRLGSILPRSKIFGSPLAILASHATFSRTKPSSQFVSSFDRSGRSSQSRDYIANTEILPFIQQRDIADIKLGPTGTLIQLWEKKSSEKSLFTESPPVCLGFCGTIVMQSRFIAPLHYQFHSRGIILKLSGGRRSIEQNVISSPKKPIPAPPLVCSIFRPFHSPRKNGVSRLPKVQHPGCIVTGPAIICKMQVIFALKPVWQHRTVIILIILTDPGLKSSVCGKFWLRKLPDFLKHIS